jgi:hypothetical protein
MSELYLPLKFLHILGATVLFGTGAGIAFFMWMAHRTRDVVVVAATARRRPRISSGSRRNGRAGSGRHRASSPEAGLQRVLTGRPTAAIKHLRCKSP